MWVRCQGVTEPVGTHRPAPLGTTWMASRRPEAAGHIRRIARRRHPTARPYRVAATAPLNCPLSASPGKSCPRLGAEMGAAIRRRLRSDAVIVALPKCSDVRQRPQAAVLFA